jgi:fibronectin type 3 domain-containing protein
VLPLIAAVVTLSQGSQAVAAVGAFARLQNHVFRQSTSSQSNQNTGAGLSIQAIPATSTSSAKVVLAWNASANATSYNVYRSTTSGAEGGTAFATGVTITTYTDTGLTNGTTYYYQVTAVNAYGESPKSNEAHATPLSSAAAFVKTDTGTQGNWKGVYGGDGYNVIDDPSLNNPSYPSYAVVTPSSNNPYIWASSTTSGTALQKAAPGSTDRIAACWYNTSGFTIDLNNTDTNVHQVALYFLDWGNNNGRAETVTISDVATNTVLDTRSVSSFSGGVYDVWNIRGHVKITFATTAGVNSVLSGIFFGGASSTIVPGAPIGLAAQSGYQQIGLTWKPTGIATSYNVYRGTASAGESATPIATGVTTTSYTDTGITGTTTYYYKVAAVNSIGVGALSNEASAASSHSVAFVKTDTSTQGSWKGVYGGDGFNIVGDTSANNPTNASYASGSVSGNTLHTWVASSILAPAMQKTAAGAPDRVASCWYNASSITFDLTIIGSPRQVALYLLDWDHNGRAETITISDATTNAVLDTRSASSFGNGVYEVWNINGHVKITVARTAGPNCVVSGMLFGTGAGSSAPASPSTFTATPSSNKVALSWSASTGATSYNVYRGSAVGAEGVTPIATGVTATTYSDTGVTSGSTYYYKVVAVNAVGGSSGSVEASALVPAATAAFVKTDTSTLGSWKSVYGLDGLNIAADPSANNPTNPSYATASMSGNSTYTWASSTSSASALEKATVGSTDRIAACWYSATSFSIDLNVTEGAHQVGLYLLDWDHNGRVETITSKDASTNAVLDSRSASSFGSGVYDIWNISGHVKITIARTSGANAVLSGLFYR